MINRRVEGRAARFVWQRPPIWVLGALSLLVYILLAIWFPLRPFYDAVPLPGINSLAPTLPTALAYALLLLFLFGLTALAYRRLTILPDPGKAWPILASAALFSLPLLFSFPINATDVYRYFVRARVGVVYGQNPYEDAPADIPQEPYLPLTGEWSDKTSPYGPLWEGVASGITRLVAARLWPALLLFKGLAALCHLAIGGLIWLIQEKTNPGRRVALTLLWTWNPALLLAFAMNGHNDALMLLWLVLGWWLISRQRAGLGMAVAFLGPLTKPIGVLALPFFFMAGLRGLNGRKEQARFLAMTIGAGLLISWAAFLPFGDPLPLARRLVTEAGSGGGYSPLVLFVLIARWLGTDPSVAISTGVTTAVFALTGLILVWLAWRGRSPLRGAADIFAGYILTALNFRIWYAAWPFPWLLLEYGGENRDSRSETRLLAGSLFLLTSQLSVLIYGRLRLSLFAGSHTLAHLVGVPFTMLIPIVIARLSTGGYSRLCGRRRGR